MNPSTDQASVAVDEVAPPPQAHRLSTSCDLHPDERFSGFCPSCLCERLTVLDHNGAPPPPPPSASRKPPIISTSALKALFKHSSGSNNNANDGRFRAGFFPELRRTKSFSAKNNEGFSAGVEPQRRSCDVRLRDIPTEEATVSSGCNIDEEAVLDEEAEIEEENDSGEITEAKSSEIVEEEEELKPMKEHMDLYPQTKKPFAGSFWSAASVFSKKLHKWRQKQKTKKHRSGRGVRRPDFAEEKAIKRQFKDTQSEIGCGRRLSGDTDPRFSLDAARFSIDTGRISLDDPRYSLDEPRASWDGHLTGRSILPPVARVPPPPSKLSTVGNATVCRSDMHEPVGASSYPSITPIINEPDPIIIIPGGSNQTRDYYTEPPSRRRKSFERSNSVRKTVTELDEVKSVTNTKVSPARSINSKTREDYTMEKKSRRWVKWSILGFIYRRGISKDEEEDIYSRSNSTGMVERSLSESWPEMRNGGGGEKMRRSNSSVSWRSSGGGGSARSKYSPKEGENGMLKFYLTPMRRRSWRTGGGGGGGGSGWEKTAARANSHGHSIARRIMRLY